MRSKRGRLLWIVLTVVVMVMISATVAGVIYFVLRQRQSGVGGWRDPVAAVQPDEVSADLALYPLAGAAELETIDAAIVNGDLETAYASLVYSQDMPNAQRIGRLVLLGQRFEESGRADRAAITYQQAYDVAVLATGLTDPARADALLAAGKGWAALGREAEALKAYDQVYLIAVRSPYLQLAHRRDLLSALERTYSALGDSEQAQAARQKIMELDQDPSPQPPARPGESPDLSVGAERVSTPEVGVLEETRRQAAYDLLQGLSEGNKPPPELASGLAQALMAEDAAKLDLYRSELEGTTQLGRRIGLHWQVIRWLTLKYRVATRGFGLSLVPEWEAQVADIQSALSKAYEDLYFDYEDMVAALPEASLIAPGSYEVRRRVIQAGRLGQYPNYPAPQLAEKLQDAVAGLITAGLLEQLYVDVVPEDGGLHFFLSPADQYGVRGTSESDNSP
jgi:tetratricopeptide (TPR) repeat protein